MYMPYILSTLYYIYIYRLHTYPKDSAVANNDFLIFLGAAQGGTKKNPVAPGRGRTQEATNGTESIAALETGEVTNNSWVS